MEPRTVRALAMFLAPAVVGIILWLIFYRDGLPMPWRVAMRPLLIAGGLALVFGPVLIGNYLAGRKGKPPLS